MAVAELRLVASDKQEFEEALDFLKSGVENAGGQLTVNTVKPGRYGNTMAYAILQTNRGTVIKVDMLPEKS